VQCYTRRRIGPAGPLPPAPGAEFTQMGYEFWPDAVEASVRYASALARVPIILTENGTATEDDSRRIAYLESALSGVARCLRSGIDVRGYFHWSLLDNFEWLFGYAPKFGLIAVDRKTQRRTVKPSAEWLGRIAQNNEI
jgi:beta-glucosidase